MAGFRRLTIKTMNVIVAGGTAAFVSGLYLYTMKAVMDTDEVQVAIDKFEGQKSKEEPEKLSKA